MKTYNPWEDEEGNLLPTSTLKIVSQNWSKEIWEAYLRTIEGRQNDVLLGNYDRVMLKEDARKSLQNYQVNQSGSDDDPLYISRAAVRKALIQLNYRQRRLVELVYLREMTIKEAAKKLGVSRQSAGLTLHRARLRMKRELTRRIEARVNDRRRIQLS